MQVMLKPAVIAGPEGFNRRKYMSHNYIAVGLAAMLTSTSLAGCATDPVTGTTTIDVAKVSSIEADVQKNAAIICGFVPTIGTVASVIASFAGAGGIATIATQAANAICSAVVPAKMAGHRRLAMRRGTAPVVNGVPVEGYFIK